MSSLELTVQEAYWEEVWPKGRDLFQAHEKELGLDGSVPFEIDHVLAAQCAAQKVLRIITAHDGEDLVGYCFWYLAPSLLSRGIMTASQGPWYVVPRLRNSSCGIRLWKVSMEMLRDSSVRQVFAHRTPASPQGLEKLFLREGGKKVEEVWEILI